MEICLGLLRKIVVDNKLDLLNIDTSSKKIGGDQNPGRSGSEFVHNLVSVSLLLSPVDKRNNKVLVRHGLGQIFNVVLLVAIDHALGNF